MVFTKAEMPAGTGGASGSNPNNNANRTVFRPPWVKDGPQPIPLPTAPWRLKNPEPKAEEASQQPKFPQLRKTSGPNTQSKENGQPVPHLEQVTLRPTPKETKPPTQTEPKVIPITIKREDSAPQQEKPKLVTQKTLRDTKEPRPVPIQRETAKPPAVRRERPPPVTKKSPAFDDEDIPSAHTLRKQDSILNIIPPAPPAPPAPPLPPPQPKIIPDGHKPLSSKQAKVLESLRQRPRQRPDWGSLLKDVEQGRKLRHVVCNDRSKPLLPATKAKTKDGEKFVYDSEKEKSNVHNLLLKEIQSGVPLRKVQTNDRSKPILEGLRKFRRQMTIEEQIQKSQSAVKLGATPDSEDIIIADDDEMDDIDKLRDDLQSTKQLLALELRNKEAQQKENKRLQARIANLEVELDHERGKAAAAVTRSVLAERMEDDKLVQSLKQEAEEARKAAKEAEKKYIKCSDELDTVKGELDEAKRQNEILQKKLEAALKALSGRRESQAVENKGEEKDEEPPEMEESESDEDDGEDNEEKREKRAKREIKMLVNKLKHVKTKKENAKKERQSLKEQMKKEQQTIKEEKKKYKHLQREVDKMAELMNTDEDANVEEKEKENVEDDEEHEELSGEEEEETSESESESSSESEDEEEQSESEPEDAPFEKRKENYTARVRRYENQLAALKKGNYLLKANIDRLKDDINKQREMSLQLQQDLDSILNDLG